MMTTLLLALLLGLSAPQDDSAAGRRGEVAVPDAEPAPEGATAIRGQVVDVRTGRGVAGFCVRLTLGEEREEVLTEADGRFSFVPAVEVKSATLWTRPPRGWRWRSPSLQFAARLTPEQLSGREEFRFEVAEKRSGPVHGVAVDQKTGTPLPNFRFSIVSRAGYRSPVETIEVLTDEEGRFQTERAVQGGRVTIKPGPGEGQPVLGEQDCLVPGPWRIEFSAEPRLEIALTGALPPDPTELRFWMMREGEARARSYSVLRQDPGGRLWVRPPTPRPDLRQGEEVVLAVADEAGHLFGARSHVWGRGSPAPLLFDLVATAVMDLDVKMTLHAADGRDRYRAGSYRRVKLTRADTRFIPGADWRLEQRRWLSPGRYDLSVSSRAHVEERRVLELVGGETERLSIRLEPLEDTRTVRGRIFTESGGPLKDFISVHLSLAEAPAAVWRASWERNRMCGTGVDHFVSLGEEDGREVGRFVFEHVPAGPVKVTTHSFTAPAVVSVAETGDGDLELEVRQIDVDEGPGFGFRVVESESGAAPARFGYRVHTRVLDNGPPIHEYAHNGQLVSRADPRTRRLEWAVVARGFRTVYGDQESFHDEGDGRFFANVTLERGWRARVLVQDREREPLVGAAVVVDGAAVGVTDATGILELERETPPGRIEASYLDWQPTRLPTVATPASLGGTAWHVISLARP